MHTGTGTPSNVRIKFSQHVQFHFLIKKNVKFALCTRVVCINPNSEFFYYFGRHVVMSQAAMH